MANKFHGTFDELRNTMDSTGVAGDWTEGANQSKQFRSREKAVLTWWPSNGTWMIQGPTAPKQNLENALVAALTSRSAQQPTKAAKAAAGGRRIFVVHGHDASARDQLELALHRLGLEPFILMNTTGGGKTIIEALEGQIGHDYSADFGIVLMTPDDIGYSKADGVDKAEPRARQNVILETGMLLASLTRTRMALLVKGHLEPPSDLQGIIRYSYNDHVREVIPKLCSRLREVGIEVDPIRISQASI